MLIARSGSQRVGGQGMGDGLDFFQLFKAGSHAEGKLAGRNECQHGLDVLAGAVNFVRRRRGQSGVVPLFVIAIHLQVEVQTIGAQMGVFVMAFHSSVALGQDIAIAHQPQRKSLLFDGGRAFHGAAPPLLLLIQKLGYGDVEAGGVKADVEDHLDVFGRLAAQDTVIHGAGMELTAEAVGEIVQGDGIEFFADQRKDVFAKAGAEFILFLGSDAGRPSASRDQDVLHRITGINIGFRVGRPGCQQAGTYEAAKPHRFHARAGCTPVASYKCL